MSEQASDVIAQELALRFRVLARALDRFDRLEGEREFVGWLAQLAGDQRTLEAVSTTLTLQAVQAAAEEGNYRMLRLLGTEEAVSLARLCDASGLDRASLYLRLGRLAHAGLVILELDGESVRSTPLGRTLSHWLGTVITETRERIAEWLELVGSTTP